MTFQEIINALKGAEVLVPYDDSGFDGIRISGSDIQIIIDALQAADSVRESTRNGFYCLDDMCEDDKLNKCKVCENSYGRGFTAGFMIGAEVKRRGMGKDRAEENRGV